MREPANGSHGAENVEGFDRASHGCDATREVWRLAIRRFHVVPVLRARCWKIVLFRHDSLACALVAFSGRSAAQVQRVRNSLRPHGRQNNPGSTDPGYKGTPFIRVDRCPAVVAPSRSYSEKILNEAALGDPRADGPEAWKVAQNCRLPSWTFLWLIVRSLPNCTFRPRTLLKP